MRRGKSFAATLMPRGAAFQPRESKHVRCDRCGSRRGVWRLERQSYLCECCAEESEFFTALPLWAPPLAAPSAGGSG